MMAAVPHVTAWAGRTKYHTDGFLFDWVYNIAFYCQAEPSSGSAVPITATYGVRELSQQYLFPNLVQL